MLTDIEIRKVKATGKPVEVAGEHGLQLEVRAGAGGGTARWWRLRQRIDGREKLPPLGISNRS